MDSLFLFLNYTTSLIDLLDKEALMYHTKDCNLKPRAEGCFKCHTSKLQWPTVLESM